MPVSERTSLAAATGAVAVSVARFFVLLLTSRIHQPTTHVGGRLLFANQSSARIYRETVVEIRRSDAPVVLVVEFRLRGVRGWVHRFFQWESVLNTPLFVGFPGFVSKLWLEHDENDVYRGIYEWDGVDRAEAYARDICRILELVSESGSVAYHVIPDQERSRYVAQAEELRRGDLLVPRTWWSIA